MQHLRIVSVVLVFLVFIECSYCDTDSLWFSWKQEHKKSYMNDIEEEMRRDIWNSNYKLIQQHNSEENTYTLALNHLADLTNEEFQKTYLASTPLELQKWKSDLAPSMHMPLMNISDIPDFVDWTDKGYVSEVKNQGSCGSCWAFSATGALEARYAMKKGKIVTLSEQELVDCSSSYGNFGCDGGLMNYAFAYVRDYGLCSSDTYQYTSSMNSCKANYCTKIMSCKGYKNIKSGYESSLAEATASVGPISVAIDASSYFFQFYSKGIFYSSTCSSSRLNHGVLVVGYGTYNGLDYWIVKNSWGSTWGKNGYIWMARNMGNNCGIATAASYPIVN